MLNDVFANFCLAFSDELQGPKRIDSLIVLVTFVLKPYGLFLLFTEIEIHDVHDFDLLNSNR